MRSLALLLPLALIGCADTLNDNAVAICRSSPGCTVTDNGPTYGPPQQVVIDQPRPK